MSYSNALPGLVENQAVLGVEAFKRSNSWLLFFFRRFLAYLFEDTDFFSRLVEITSLTRCRWRVEVAAAATVGIGGRGRDVFERGRC